MCGVEERLGGRGWGGAAVAGGGLGSSGADLQVVQRKGFNPESPGSLHFCPFEDDGATAFELPEQNKGQQATPLIFKALHDPKYVTPSESQRTNRLKSCMQIIKQQQ